MTQCINCGCDTNKAGAKFCMKCGARLTFLAPGEVLQGRYKIVQVLGKGGMGAVCLAEDIEAFGGKCVVKEMIEYFNPSDPNEVKKAQKRFEDEARTLADLKHPSIPEVRHYFSEAGRNYMVMTFVPGENLEARLKREGKPLPWDEVVPYAIQVCHVLEYLSTRNPPLVHHDIKPANIIFNRETHSVSLVDFGTAKVRPAQGSGQLGKAQSSVYGTIGYAPPEQYGDQPKTEPRSDVYALGATMYHLLTNDDPGDHPMSFPRLSTLPTNIRNVLERALDNDVGKRIAAGEMRRALEKIIAVGPAVQPFVFPSGEQAHSIEELARLCDQHWEDARRLLYDSSFETWLRTSLFRNDLARQARQLMTQSDQNAALEQFLRLLDPTLPSPEPTTGLSRLDFGRIGPKKRVTKTLSVSNKTARGYLYGQVMVDPPVAWLSVAPAAFSGSNVSLTVTVDTGGQAQGERLSTHLTIKSPTGTQESVLVSARVAFDWLRFLRSLLFFAVMGGLLGAAGGYLVGQPVLADRPGTTPYSVPGEILIALTGLGLLSALVIAVSMGSALGGPKRFSAWGCLLWLLLSVPVLGYLFLVMQAQLWSLRIAAGDTVAYIGLAILGAFLFLLLGIFRGLSKAGRRVLRWLVPLLLIIGSAAWVAWEPQVRLDTTTPYRLDLGWLQPLFRALPDGRWGFWRERLLVTHVDLPIPYIVVDEAFARRFAFFLSAMERIRWPR